MEKIIIQSLKNIEKKDVEKIAQNILDQKVALLPASTIYGLSCKYDKKAPYKKIYEIKKRPEGIPFIILISRQSQLNLLASNISSNAEKLISDFWSLNSPCPLTIIFDKYRGLPSFVTAGKKKIAIRLAVPKYLRQVIDITGPITSTSATISGQKSYPDTIKKIKNNILKNVDLVVEYEGKLGGAESTIIDITDKPPTIIRKGIIKYSKLRKYLG